MADSVQIVHVAKFVKKYLSVLKEKVALYSAQIAFTYIDSCLRFFTI